MADDEIVEARTLAHRRMRIDVTALCRGRRKTVDERIEIYAGPPILGWKVIRGVVQSGKEPLDAERDGVVAACSFHEQRAVDEDAVAGTSGHNVSHFDLAIDPCRRIHRLHGIHDCYGPALARSAQNVMHAVAHELEAGIVFDAARRTALVETVLWRNAHSGPVYRDQNIIRIDERSDTNNISGEARMRNGNESALRQAAGSTVAEVGRSRSPPEPGALHNRPRHDLRGLGHGLRRKVKDRVADAWVVAERSPGDEAIDGRRSGASLRGVGEAPVDLFVSVVTERGEPFRLTPRAKNLRALRTVCALLLVEPVLRRRRHGHAAEIAQSEARALAVEHAPAVLPGLRLEVEVPQHQGVAGGSYPNVQVIACAHEIQHAARDPAIEPDRVG